MSIDQEELAPPGTFEAPEALPLAHESQISGELPAEPAALRRRVLNLAWPVIGENLLETLLHIVDTMLVAGLGVAALAGVGSALQIMFFVLSALSALAVGSSILVAQAIGARSPERASELARQSLIWSVLLSVPLALAGLLLAAPIMGIFGLEPDVAAIATDYFAVTMGTVVVLVALIIGGGVLRGVGDSRTPMVVTAIANVVNLGLAYGLINGVGPLPMLGAVGSAWATFMARGVALLLLLRVLWRGRNGVSIAGSGTWLPDWSVARHVLRLGVPAAVEQILMSAGFLVLTILVAHLGTDALAAQRISISALTFSFLPGIGFSIAATALVGQTIGARRPAEGGRVATIATTWAVIWMSSIAALLFIFATPIMRIFTDQEEVIRIGADGLRIVALTQPFWAVGIVQSGALRGTGDTRFPLLIGTAGIWSAVGLAWLGLNLLEGGLTIVWGAFLISSPVTSFLTWRQLRRRLQQVEVEQESGVEQRPQLYTPHG